MSDERRQQMRDDGRDEVDLVDLGNWIIGAMLVAILGAFAYRYVNPGGVAGLVGQPAPEAQAELLGSGQMASISDYRGKVVVMDFWATWCPPCHEQSRRLQKMMQDSSVANKAVVLMVNADKSAPGRKKKVRAYLERRGLRFPTLLDNGRLVHAYGVQSFPTLVVIAPDGTVTFAESGLHPTSSIKQAIKAAE